MGNWWQTVVDWWSMVEWWLCDGSLTLSQRWVMVSFWFWNTWIMLNCGQDCWRQWFSNSFWWDGRMDRNYNDLDIAMPGTRFVQLEPSTGSQDCHWYLVATCVATVYRHWAAWCAELLAFIWWAIDGYLLVDGCLKFAVKVADWSIMLSSLSKLRQLIRLMVG